jgi:hypothetical protein
MALRSFRDNSSSPPVAGRRLSTSKVDLTVEAICEFAAGEK